MVHATLTGYAAGQPYCGVNKEQARMAGDTFAHPPYSRTEEWFSRPDVCPACRAEWDAAADPGANADLD